MLQVLKEQKSNADLEVNIFLCHFHIFSSVFISVQFIGLIFVKCKVCQDFWGLLIFSLFECYLSPGGFVSKADWKKCYCASGLDFTPVWANDKVKLGFQLK